MYNVETRKALMQSNKGRPSKNAAGEAQLVDN
jgi:hypothetical protein